MATPHSTPNCAPDGGTTPTPTTTLMTTGIASLPTNSTSQTLLPLPALVTAIAQSTMSSVERVLDQPFTSLLREQQQLVSAVQQLACPQGSGVPFVVVVKPTNRTAQQHAGKGSPRNPQLQIPPATILRSIPLITTVQFAFLSNVGANPDTVCG